MPQGWSISELADTGRYRSILVGVRGSSRDPQRGESPGKSGGREGLGQGGGTPSSSKLQAGTRTVQGVARHPGTRARVTSAPRLALRDSQGPSLLLEVDGDGATAIDLRECGCLCVWVP